MENNGKQQSGPQMGKDNVKDNKQNQTGGKEKDWWEQLMGTTEQDGIKGIYKLITHPLALITVLVFVIVWSLKQKKTDSGISKQNEELKGELATMKKKYKKLKKRLETIREETDNPTTENFDKPVKRPLALID
jgi:membrane protein insertase Oxa1/YidC/SpoIIIJ